MAAVMMSPATAIKLVNDLAVLSFMDRVVLWLATTECWCHTYRRRLLIPVDKIYWQLASITRCGTRYPVTA